MHTCWARGWLDSANQSWQYQNHNEPFYIKHCESNRRWALRRAVMLNSSPTTEPTFTAERILHARKPLLPKILLPKPPLSDFLHSMCLFFVLGRLFWPTRKLSKQHTELGYQSRGKKGSSSPFFCVSPLSPRLTLPESLEVAKCGHGCLACWTDCARKENKTQMYTNSSRCQWRDS